MNASLGKLRPPIRLMVALFLLGVAFIYWRAVAIAAIAICFLIIFFFPMVIHLIASVCLLRRSKLVAGVLFVGAIVAIAICICAPWERPHFGNDVGGTFAGAEFQFKKAQVVGWLSLAISLPLGLLAEWLTMRCRPNRSRVAA